ncbi:MAG TPA: Ku protein [Spongiibacteraceae bacterium]|jgi:DNA end-binding protein Ku
MARPIWSGIISFGLLNIPISLHAAERRIDLHFRMIDSRSQTPIRYERVNAETGEEVPWKDIVQAFEYQKGNYVVLSKEDIASAAPHGKESIDIEAFVDRDAISPLFFEKPYYLIPGKKAEKGYALLREILRKTHRAGIGYVVIRTRRYLAAVLVEGEALLLNLLRFPQEVVEADNFIFPSDNLSELRISPRELEMATQLVDSMTVPWNAENYVDDYREQLTKIVEKRLAKKQGLVQEPGAEEEVPAEAATNVVDFMSLLKESLKKKQPADKNAKAELKQKSEARQKSPTRAKKSETDAKSAAKKPAAKAGARKTRKAM